MKRKRIGPAGRAQESAGRVQVLVNKDILPAHQGIIQYQDRVVFIQPAR